LPVATVKGQTEVELKFLVPAAARADIATEMARGSATLERLSLAARYLDTDDRRLAQAGIAWRLRREGRRWIQTLKAGGTNALERLEHEVMRPDASHDASKHAGTPVGDRLIALLRRARTDGVELGVRFQTEVRRTARRIRTRGTIVEVAFDEGRLLSAKSTQRIREIEFELISGSTAAMLALAERWRKRFGLIYDPRSKAERGDQLAEGSPFPPLRKASQPRYSDAATATEAFGAVLDECLAQITRNAVGLIEGDPALRVEHVHQLRVGIRRIRSALRSFQGWAPSAPADLVEDLRSLFATLGMTRDSDVLDSGVVAELAKFGAPPLTLPAGAAGPDPAEAVGATNTQRTFLAWIAWRATLADDPDLEVDAVAADPAAVDPSEGEADAADGEQAESEANQAAPDDAPTFRRNAERRLRRWHRRIIADWNAFDALDEAGLHALRKRIKRQRYAVEFFAPVLRRRKVERYLTALALIQDRMGELNDLFVARARYQSLVMSDAAAWFALGWLAARIAEVRALAKPELGRLAKVDSPTNRE
jgi:inorganic triphosphatase YgiF